MKTIKEIINENKQSKYRVSLVDCKNSEELLELAKAEGIELTSEQLTAISGGGACSFVSDVGDKINPYDCPKCGANDPKKDGNLRICKKCGYQWTNSENAH